MSSSTGAQTVTVDEDRLAALERRVTQLEEENEELRERVDNLEDQPSIERRENDKTGRHISEYWVDGVPLGKAVQNNREQRKDLKSSLDNVEERVDAVEDVPDAVEQLQDDLRSEQKMRSQQDSLVERRVNAVAEQAGVEVSDADLVDDDKLAQLLKIGPEAVTDRVYAVHRRARALLQNAEEWGRTVDDTNGVRVTFHGPTVRPFLEARFNRSFSSGEVGRVFAKVEDLAEDSPRRVNHGKTADGEHKLRVGVLHEQDPLYWEDA